VIINQPFYFIKRDGMKRNNILNTSRTDVGKIDLPMSEIIDALYLRFKGKGIGTELPL
jgi:hypothetical protein